MRRSPLVQGLRGCLLLAGVATVLSACGSDKVRTFGVNPDGTDEVRVRTPPPLSVPPLLSQRPPRPGAPADDGAGGGAGGSEPASPGEESLLDAAGPSVPDTIRARIDRDAQVQAGDRSLTDRVLFSQEGHPPGSPPMIQRGGGGSWFGSIF
ncbi:MAG: DUF3035 domain-containing protein [Acetobacteraceae bacterium]|nr:DUF3035 domain-containing protein [Acetobacteraceae bacterium]MBV8526375.1 DUF3035 domain-containing protein [Acetobacteraceae bacterium]